MDVDQGQTFPVSVTMITNGTHTVGRDVTREALTEYSGESSWVSPKIADALRK